MKHTPQNPAETLLRTHNGCTRTEVTEADAARKEAEIITGSQWHHYFVVARRPLGTGSENGFGRCALTMG